MDPTPTTEADAPSTSIPSRSLSDLPFEIICVIASHLCHVATSSIHPRQEATSIDDDHESSDLISNVLSPASSSSASIGDFASSSSNTQDLLALAYSCRKCYFATLPSLYNSLALPRTRQVRLLAQSLTQRYQPKSNDLEEYNRSNRNIRHLFLPNDGLLIGKDQLSDQAHWAPSLRTIFENADMLESILLGSRSDGAALSEFLSEEVKCRPKRMTILNFYASPPFSLYNLRPLSHLTHLHLINLIPRDAIINLLSGASPYADSSLPSPPLSHLRLSQLNPETLHNFEEFITWRRATEKWDTERGPNATRAAAAGQAPPPARPRGSARRFEAQETLYTLAMASAKMPLFHTLILELSSLASLPEPEHLPLLNDSTNNSSFGQIGDDIRYEATDETTLIQESERSRTALRDAYWIDVRDGKESLQELFNEIRRPLSLPDISIRIALPKVGGWDRIECRREFECSAQALEEDGSCFADPDVFTLSSHRPWLGYNGPLKDDWCKSSKLDIDDWNNNIVQHCWWNGMLPRYNAESQ